MKKRVDKVYLSGSEKGRVVGSCDVVVNFRDLPRRGDLLTKWQTVYPLKENTAV
jgi:hypothetical protein